MMVTASCEASHNSGIHLRIKLSLSLLRRPQYCHVVLDDMVVMNIEHRRRFERTKERDLLHVRLFYHLQGQLPDDLTSGRGSERNDAV